MISDFTGEYMSCRSISLKTACLIIVCILILPLSAFSETTVISFKNTLPININNFASATPYPSAISVNNITGKVLSLQVKLHNLSHTWPDDIGVLLLGPNGEQIVLMDGVGGNTPVVSTNLTFSDSGNTLTNAPITSGTYRPTNLDNTTNIPFPSPAPAGPYVPTFSALNISNPNGIWKLYVRDISSVSDFGEIANGWQLDLLVLQGTEIIGQPQNNTISNNQSTTLNVSATTSSGTLSYQWYKGYSGDISAPVPGATNSSYTTPQLTNPANYWVRVTGGAGIAADSATAQVITSTLKGPFKNSSPITISDNAAATPFPAPITVSGVQGTVYGVRVSLANFNHSFPSDVGILLVGPQGQKVVLMDKAGGATEIVNANLVFSDTGNLLTSNPITSGTYRPANLASASTRTFPSPAPAKPYANTLAAFNGINPNGTWQLFTRDAADQNGGSINGGWQIEFMTLQGTLITTQPKSIIIPSNQVTTLAVTAITSTSSINYQWYHGNSGDTSKLITGATSRSYTTSLFSEGPSSYWVQVIDGAGTKVNSNTAQVQTATSHGPFNNSSYISIIDNAAANLYPSQINVSGVIGSVIGLRVNLMIVNHANPADIGVLLVGPQGQKVVLMDNAGGVNDISTVNLIFTDSGDALTTDQITSGSYRPSNLAAPMTRSFPAPAPPEMYDSSLAAFNGIVPNGTWKLFVRDAVKGGYGSIEGGWNLEIQTKAHTLLVNTEGNGQGRILHHERNLSFNTSYVTAVDSGVQVTLEATPDQYSTFTGWTGSSTCSSEFCQFIINSNVKATANFNFDSSHAVLVDPVHQYHTNIDTAYRAATTYNGSTIKLWSTIYAGNLLLDSTKTIALQGGYNSSYETQSPNDTSFIKGTMKIRAGKLIANHITIQ